MRWLGVLFWMLALSSTAQAAIDCADAGAVEFYNATPADPETISYTPPAGANQIMFVGVGQRHSAGALSFTITYNGVAMTLATTETYTDPIGGDLYYMVNPPSGAHNVVVDWSAAPLADTIIIWTCTGVNTSNPFRSVNSATGASATPSVTVSSVNTGDVVVDFMVSEDPADATVGANQTVIHVGNAGAEIGGGASRQAGADGGVMDWTITSQQWSSHAVALIPQSPVHATPVVFP